MLRLYLHVNNGSKRRFNLPWDYHEEIVTFVYNSLGLEDPEKSCDFHQFSHAPPFAFSDFWQTEEVKTKDDKGLYATEGFFTFTSTQEEVIEAINANRENLKTGHTDIPVVGSSIERIEGERGANVYKSLSPVSVGEKSPPEDRAREWYLPFNDEWNNRLEQSVRDRIKHTREGGLPDDFKFNVVTNIDFEKDNRYITTVMTDDGETKEIRVPAARNLEIVLETDEYTDRFIQTHGLGERTGLGFGEVMKKEEIPGGGYRA